MAQLIRLFEAVVAEPDRKIEQLDLLEASERTQLLAEFNKTQAEYPAEVQVQELFERSVDADAQRTALVFGDERMSYGELEAKANRLGHPLREDHGVGPDVLVGICLERSLEMVVGILGILKAGGAYVPLDPTYPEERLNFMLEDSAVRVVLSKGAMPAGLKVKGTVLDLSQEQVYAPDSTRLPRVGNSRNLAYVIYTSGSTGKPKGVLVEHRGAVNSTFARMHFYRERISRYLLLSSFSFDNSIGGLFWALSQQGCVVLLPQEAQPDVGAILKVIQRDAVTHILVVPSLYSAILTEGRSEQLASLGTVILGGETLPVPLISEHRRKCDGAALFNEYGPTEATVWSTVFPLDKNYSRGDVPIGKPIANA